MLSLLFKIYDIVDKAILIYLWLFCLVTVREHTNEKIKLSIIFPNLICIWWWWSNKLQQQRSSSYRRKLAIVFTEVVKINKWESIRRNVCILNGITNKRGTSTKRNNNSNKNRFLMNHTRINKNIRLFCLPHIDISIDIIYHSFPPIQIDQSILCVCILWGWTFGIVSIINACALFFSPLAWPLINFNSFCSESLSLYIFSNYFLRAMEPSTFHTDRSVARAVVVELKINIYIEFFNFQILLRTR